jgi:hypothetical protein
MGFSKSGRRGEQGQRAFHPQMDPIRQPGSVDELSRQSGDRDLGPQQRRSWYGIRIGEHFDPDPLLLYNIKPEMLSAYARIGPNSRPAAAASKT